ncbi:MAG: hypothetical protein H0U72_11260 [Nitrosospira sp.]|nr:hypothetical protein [Nitrosospira sp.]
MNDTTLQFLVINLSKIEAIAEELPRIGKRSDLKVKADEIKKLTEIARNQAYLIQNEKSKEKYAPDLGQMFGGAKSGKKE